MSSRVSYFVHPCGPDGPCDEFYECSHMMRVIEEADDGNMPAAHRLALALWERDAREGLSVLRPPGHYGMALIDRHCDGCGCGLPSRKCPTCGLAS